MVVITHYSNVFMEMANFVQAVAMRRGREELRKLGVLSVVPRLAGSTYSAINNT